jgi:hypothetical protein
MFRDRNDKGSVDAVRIYACGHQDLRNLSQKKGNESGGRSRKPHPVRAGQFTYNQMWDLCVKGEIDELGTQKQTLKDTESKES